jgi:hypothetical protein
MTKKCSNALITAPTAQINGGKAMTPGLSDEVFVSILTRFSNLIDSPQNSLENRIELVKPAPSNL